MNNLKYLVVISATQTFDLMRLDELSTVDIMIISDDYGTFQVHPPPHHFKQVIIANTTFIQLYLGSAGNVRGLINNFGRTNRNFGLYYAYKEGYDVVIMLDENCITTITPDFLDQVPVLRQFTGSWVYDTPSGWVNTLYPLDDAGLVGGGLYPRGYPYEFREEKIETWSSPDPVTSWFNQGLWVGVPDINGIDQAQYRYEIPRVPVNLGIWKLKSGQRMPLSSANAQIAVALIPAFYQPTSYELGNWRLRGYEDIWSMAFLKTIMDREGFAATFGDPVVVRNSKADVMESVYSEMIPSIIQPWLFRVIEVANNWMVPINDVHEVGAIAAQAIYLAQCMHKALITVRPPGSIYWILYSWIDSCYQWARLFL